MSAQRQILSGSRRSLPLYVLLLSTLVLAGILGFQAYDAARSHRATAQQALRDYAQLANWRYQDWAYWVVEKSLADAFSPLGYNYEVHRETLWRPSVLIGAKRDPGCPCPPMPDLKYAFRIERRTGTMATAGTAPRRDELEWIRERVLAHADTGYNAGEDPFGILFDAPADTTKMYSYTLRADRSGDEFIYGFELEWDVLPRILKGTPLDTPLLPASLTGNVPNESFLSVAVGMPPKHAFVVLGDSVSKEYWAGEAMQGPFASLSVYVGLEPGVAEQLVIGGLPASRLPIVLGAFLLAAGLILAAAHQIRRENELARSRADFAMGVSHELRTPLTQIRMFLESVLLGRTESPSQRQQYLEIAHEEAKRLSSLIDNVLRLSRVERGTARLDARPVDLSELTRSLIDGWVPGISGESMRLELELAADVPVLADPEALRAILGNLVDNAVKYGPPEQTIVVGTAKSDRTARLWVRDEGPGVPREDRKLIWQPYRRLDRDARSAVAGTGIGLAIVLEYVRLHGGNVWVEDAEDRGARFVVELPLDGERNAPAEAVTQRGQTSEVRSER
jgi:signal transduction histidine kinase